MAGLKIVLPVTFTDTSLPILRKDRRLTNGSLYLSDVAHSYDPFPAGVLAHGTAIPNIAWEEAAAVLGAGTQTTLKGQYVNLFDSATYAVFERTPKGGFHGMISQAADAPSSPAAKNASYIALPTLLRDYIYANTGHSFYMSSWRKVTRIAKAGAAAELPLSGVVNSTQSTGRYMSYFDRLVSKPTSGALIASRASPGVNTLGNTFRNIGNAGWTSTSPTSNIDLNSFFPAWGAPGAWSGFGSQYAQSHVFYAGYLEDLTVSGRTYAQVDAIDKAMFDADFASGGRYYGDTNSDPATVVP